jgi:hypothetical protein
LTPFVKRFLAGLHRGWLLAAVGFSTGVDNTGFSRRLYQQSPFFFAGREMAREYPESAAGCQASRVIVGLHREQARFYRRFCMR